MDKDTLADDKDAFKDAVEAEADQRKESLEQLRFARMGEQWPDEVKRQREKDGRPCLTINRCPAFAKQVTNDARQNRPRINVHPVGDGATKDTAQVLNGLIRNIENCSRADIVYDTALEFAVYMGFGYMVVRTDYAFDDSFDQDICIERVSNPFAVYGDPMSKEADSSDWNSAFITDMMPKAEFKRRWLGASTKGFENDDRDEKTALWYEDKAIRVAERWFREEKAAKLLKLSDGTLMLEEDYKKPENQEYFKVVGVTVTGDRMTKTHKVGQRIISGEEILETNEWRGKYIPIIPVYGDEANIEGKRYFHGLFKFAMDSQRMVNYWRTASTEQVALASRMPWVGAVGAFSTDPKWASANSASHAYVEYDPVPGEPPPQRQPFPGVPPGALQEALNASDDMKNILGIHDASLGARSNETSGVAIRARKVEGDTSTYNFIDNLSRGIEHLGRVIVDLIPKVYTAPRMIRSIKEDGSTYEVPVNQPVMPAPPQEGQQRMPGQAQEQFQPAPQPIPPEMTALVKVFDLTTGKYDVTVQAGPSFTSKREEAAEQMMEFMRVYPAGAPLIGDLLAKNLDWPGSDEVAERLKAMLPPQAVGGTDAIANQLTQQMQQQDQMAREAIANLDAQLKATEAKLQDKQFENQLKQGELQLKDRELTIKERETMQKLASEQIEADGKRAQMIDIPRQYQMMDAQALGAVVQALQQTAASMEGIKQAKPRVKKAKAMKQKDGSYIMESIESDID